MRIKSQQPRHPTFPPGRIHCPRDYSLMPEMHAIKHTKRQMQGMPHIRQVFQGPANPHEMKITAPSPPFKLGA